MVCKHELVVSRNVNGGIRGVCYEAARVAQEGYATEVVIQITNNSGGIKPSSHRVAALEHSLYGASEQELAMQAGMHLHLLIGHHGPEGVYYARVHVAKGCA